MGTPLRQEILQLMPLILRGEMLPQEERESQGLNPLQDLEVGQREGSVVALVPVATVRVAQEVFMQRKMRKSPHHGVSLAFVL